MKLKGAAYASYVVSNCAWETSMVAKTKGNENYVKDRKIYGESNMWSTAQT